MEGYFIYSHGNGYYNGLVVSYFYKWFNNISLAHVIDLRIFLEKFKEGKMNFDIKHDAKNRKFCTIISGKECSLKYEKISDHILDFKQIFVPKNLRGQGIGGRLVEFGFQYAKKNMMKVKPSCSYVMEFTEIKLEYKELLYNPTAVVTPG